MDDTPKSAASGTIALSEIEGSAVLQLGGDWTLAHYRTLAARVAQFRAQAEQAGCVDFGGIGALDTAGASLLFDLLDTDRLAQACSPDSALAPERRALIEAVRTALAQNPDPVPAPRNSTLGDILEHIGLASARFWRDGIGLLGFIGLTLEATACTVFQPQR